MKLTIVVGLLGLGLSVPTFANTIKECVYQRGSSNDRGGKFFLNVDEDHIDVKTTMGQWEGTGTYLRVEASDVDGVDGNTYYYYDLGNQEGDSHILVDSGLLKPRTKALLKIRWRGESFYDDVYVCSDY